MDPADVDRFTALDIRVGRITRAIQNRTARRPALVLDIDFGDEIGTKRSSAQIAETYTPESVAGRLVLAVVNLSTKRVAGIDSEVLVLGVYSGGGDGPVVLIAPDDHPAIQPGDRLG